MYAWEEFFDFEPIADNDEFWEIIKNAAIDCEIEDRDKDDGVNPDTPKGRKYE